MKYGIIGVNVGGANTAETLVALAKKAEEVGMESLWTFEHVVVPLEYKRNVLDTGSNLVTRTEGRWIPSPNL